MQINGTPLTPRQAHLVRGALHREQARVLDAMMMLDTDTVHPQARTHISGAFNLTLDEISHLITLTHQEGAAK